jgi:VWFA-related protein
MLSRLAGSALVTVMALGVSPVAGPAAGQRASREQQVVAAAVDKGGKAVPGLSTADFIVREDGVAREVLRVEQASAPMQIVVLVDTSNDMQVVLQDVRRGLQAFARALWAKSPESNITLMEIGERPRQIGSPTTEAKALDGNINALVEHSGAGTYLLDGLVEAAAQLKNRHAERPVIVVFEREASQEFSTRLAAQVESAIKDAHATLWTLVLQEGDRPDTSNERRERDLALGDTAAHSGGARDALLNRISIESRFTQLADRLTSQYAITYSRPESLIPPTRLDVTSKRAGVRIQAPQWTTE